MNWYRTIKIAETPDNFSSSFIVSTVLTKYPTRTRAIVKFLDGPCVGQLGDFGIEAAVEEKKAYKGNVTLDFGRVTMANSCGRISNIGEI